MQKRFRHPSSKVRQKKVQYTEGHRVTKGLLDVLEVFALFLESRLSQTQSTFISRAPVGALKSLFSGESNQRDKKVKS